MVFMEYKAGWAPQLVWRFRKEKYLLPLSVFEAPNHRARNVVSVASTLTPFQRVLMKAITRSLQAVYMQSMNLI
jgi:hypothetical protein